MSNEFDFFEPILPLGEENGTMTVSLLVEHMLEMINKDDKINQCDKKFFIHELLSGIDIPFINKIPSHDEILSWMKTVVSSLVEKKESKKRKFESCSSFDVIEEKHLLKKLDKMSKKELDKNQKFLMNNLQSDFEFDFDDFLLDDLERYF